MTEPNTISAEDFFNPREIQPGVQGPARAPGPSIPQPTPQATARISAEDFMRFPKPRQNVQDPSAGILEAAASFGQGINVGLTSVVSGLVDLTNLGFAFVDMGMHAGGIPQSFKLSSAEPLGGSRSMRRALAAASLAPEIGEDAAVPFLFRSGQTVGGSASLMLPFAAAIKANALTKQFGLLTPMAQMYRKAPLKTTIQELAAAKSAGVAAATAQAYYPGDITIELLAETGGGVLPFFLVKGGAGAYNMVRNRLAPYSPQAIKARAAARIGEVITAGIGDDELLKSDLIDSVLKELTGDLGSLRGAETPAQITQNAGLLALERTTLLKSAEQMGDYRGMVNALSQALGAEARSTLGGGVQPESAQTFIRDRVARMNELLERRLNAAVIAARRKIADLTPQGITASQAGKIVKKELDLVFEEASLNSAAGFTTIMRSEKVSTQQVFAMWNDILSKRSKGSNDEDIPQFLRDRMQGGGKDRFTREETVGTLIDFRSELLSMIRKEASLPSDKRNKKMISLLGRMQKSVMGGEETVFIRGIPEKKQITGAIEASADKHGIGQAMDIANDFYTRFTKGSIGKIFNIDEGATGAIIPESTLISTIMQKGVKGAEAFDRLYALVSDNPRVLLENAEITIKEAWLKQVAPDGVLNDSSAKTFMKNNAELMDRFPELRAAFRDARRAQAIATNMTKKVDYVKQSSYSKSKSNLALYIGGHPGSGIQRVLNSRDPVAAMDDVIRSAKRDPTGDALKSLKEEFFEQMIAKAELTSYSHGDDLAYSGKFMNEFLFENNTTAAVASRLYTSQQLEQAKELIRVAREVEVSLTNRRQFDTIVDEPDTVSKSIIKGLYTIMATRGGAMFGAKVSGASLVLAGKASKAANSLMDVTPFHKVEALIARAMLDRELFTLVMTEYRTAAQERRLLARLGTFTADYLNQDYEDPEWPGPRTQGIQ